MRARMTNAAWAVLLCGAALAAGPGQAQTAETRPPADQDHDKDRLTVTGQRMPAAEAPRSATCEAMALDPIFRAQLGAARGEPLMGPRFYLPTRLPRNPDYGAPPKVPAGSPLPELPKSRFGQRNRAEDGGWDPGFAGATVGNEASSIQMDQYGLDSAIAACRNLYAPGGSTGVTGVGAGFAPASSAAAEGGTIQFDREVRAASAQARFAQARAFIASRDRTLPMGFALFDQGRYAESLVWFHRAARKLQLRQGGDEAALFVGKLYLQGLGDKSDPVEGVRWLKKVATAPFNPTIELPVFDPRQPERNTAVGEAAVILANLYRTGFGGIAKDPVEARKWYARASRVGHVPAAKTLGDLYYSGVDVPRDVQKAMSYYREAARLDHPAAQFALAEILSAGDDGVAQDRRAALAWYRAAAVNDHPGALHALARAYDTGDGVAPDPERAIGLYKAAALAGSPPARVAMGIYFHEGKQVPRDAAAARRWFEIAAADGDSDGMFNLAAMLANGAGGDKDLPRAWAWLAQSAALGHETAPQAIAALEKRMTPAEKAAAAALLPRGGRGSTEP
jgi:uncharacterized protein